jgi:hypothetical protein
METQRWINQTQPPNLFNAQIFLYIRAVFGLLSLLGGSVFAIPSVLGALGAYGIANEKKWGYQVAIGTAVFSLAFTVLLILSAGLHFSLIIGLLFDLLLVGLLLHPTSRSYARIWFK